MNASELRQKSLAELELLLNERRRELFALRLRHVTGQLDKTSQLKEMRRDIARIHTIIKEREEV